MQMRYGISRRAWSASVFKIRKDNLVHYAHKRIALTFCNDRLTSREGEALWHEKAKSDELVTCLQCLHSDSIL
jgi:hypothetical protein